MIESKYTIEYVNPEESSKTTSRSRKNQYGFALGGLVLAALAYFLITLPAKKTTHQPKVVLSQQQPIKETTNEVNILPASTQALKEKVSVIKTNDVNLTPDIKTFDSTNEEHKTIQTSTQAESLEKLKAQLLDTQNRNKALATELDAQIMENMELATLLEDSLYKINKKDKSYIKELRKLEQNTVAITTNNAISNKPLTIKTPVIIDAGSNNLASDKKKTEMKNKINPSFAVSQDVKKVPMPAQKINRVDLSTTAQVDAIIANLNRTNKSNRQTQLKNRQRGKDGIEASKVKLQTDINNMINSSKESKSDKFQESLKDI